MTQRSARGFRQAVAAPGLGNGKIGERRAIRRQLIQPLHTLVGNEFALHGSRGVAAQTEFRSPVRVPGS